MTEIHALSGAYAVDALDDLERAAFERHLAECAECRAEVASLREAAGLLAETTTSTPPSALRDRVLADVSTIRPLPPHTQAPTRRRRRLTGLVAAAAAALVLGGGAVAWHPWTDETSQHELSVAEQVLQAPDATSRSKVFPGGASATVTHSESLQEAVIVTEHMPPPPRGRVYQLWLNQPGKGMVSAGVMPVKADQTVLLDGNAATATAAGITVEPDGGSDAPTSDPIALFAFGGPA